MVLNFRAKIAVFVHSRTFSIERVGKFRGTKMKMVAFVVETVSLLVVIFLVIV